MAASASDPEQELRHEFLLSPLHQWTEAERKFLDRVLEKSYDVRHLFTSFISEFVLDFWRLVRFSSFFLALQGSCRPGSQDDPRAGGAGRQGSGLDWTTSAKGPLFRTLFSRLISLLGWPC